MKFMCEDVRCGSHVRSCEGVIVSFDHLNSTILGYM